jgi:hypothetical protein
MISCIQFNLLFFLLRSIVEGFKHRSMLSNIDLHKVYESFSLGDDVDIDTKYQDMRHDMSKPGARGVCGWNGPRHLTCSMHETPSS